MPNIIQINGTWFNLLKVEYEQRNHPVPDKMTNVPKDHRQWAKEQVKQNCHNIYPFAQLHIRTSGNRLIALDENGNLFGYIAKEDMYKVTEGEIVTIRHAHEHDGNVIIII